MNAVIQTLLALCRPGLRWISSARFRRRLGDRVRALQAAFSPLVLGIAIAIVLSLALKETTLAARASSRPASGEDMK